MACSSGNSSGTTTQIQNSGSEEVLMDDRKRKRMLSNRESARRSRMRKQKHVGDLVTQLAQLKNENNKIINSINMNTTKYDNVEAENSVLRAQMMELSQRLHSLNDILSYININGGFETETQEDDVVQNCPENFMNNPWNFMYQNQQPIVASADMLYQY